MSDRGTRERRIVNAVDFGFKGLAFCTLDASTYPPVLLKLEKEPDVGVANTARLATDVAVNLFHKMPQAHVYVLESQMGLNRVTVMQECGVAAAAKTALPNSDIVHLSCARITREFDMPKGHYSRKLVATERALDILQDPSQIVINDNGVLRSLLTEQRKHDMADALLLGMVYCRELHGMLQHPLRRRAGSKTDTRIAAADDEEQMDVTSEAYKPKRKKTKKPKT